MTHEDNTVLPDLTVACDTVSRLIDVRRRLITPSTSFRNDLGADSLDVLQVLIEVEAKASGNYVCTVA